ncbi:MAG: aminotransferase class V-fold PLP-dependent enzyme [Desulfobacterales bacterium]|nr:aminotransferase class V-fold PLP-dependent enzyme [Desulfobacterales bacterium]
MISPIDLKRIRAETPGCEAVLHFNNAGASLPPQPVYQAVTDHLKLESRIGGYEAEAHAQEKLQRFYQAFARLLNCDPVEIAFIENATRAWDMVFYAIPFKPGDRILTARAEYASNYLAFLHVAKQKDLKIDVVPNDASGQISIDALEEMIDEDVKLIAITHVPTQGGLINPAEAVGQIARRHNILYLLDACQSVGQMPIDVRKIKCDMLSGTGRKYLRGPRGTGFLFIRRPLIELLEPPFIDLHAATWIDKDQFKIRNDARRFENWESYIAGRIGLATAVDYALEIGLEAIQERVQYLAALLRNRLSEFAGVVVRDLGRHRCGIVTFTKENESASALKQRLASHQINISVSPARYARLDLDSRGISELARASVHYFNSEAEIDRFCTKLSQ